MMNYDIDDQDIGDFQLFKENGDTSIKNGINLGWGFRVNYQLLHSLDMLISLIVLLISRVPNLRMLQLLRDNIFSVKFRI